MLETIGLTNFKAFADLELPLGALTLLTGLNGSGKSSVLQAIGMLRQSFETEALQRGELDLNGPLVAIGTGYDALHQDFELPELSIWCTSAEAGQRERLEWIAPFVRDADVLACKQGSASETLERHNIFRPGFQFLRADRITPSVTLPRSQNAIVHSRSLGPRGEFTAHFLLHFGQELEVPAALRSKADSGTSLSAQVDAWMQSFSPGVRVEAFEVPMTDLVRLAFSFRGSKAAYGGPLRPTNVGFGLTHVLPVIVACLSAMPGNLIIVENPEAQLHPRGQAAMGRLLAMTAALGAQVIVETHSDHVLNGIRLAAKQGELDPSTVRLHFFSKGSSASADFETPELGGDGRLSYWPEGFFDQWDRSLDELLA